MSGRPPRRRLLTAIGCALVLALSLAEPGAAEKAESTLIVEDVLTAPLKEAVLTAQLMEPGLLRSTPLGGEVLHFSIGAKDLGRVLDLSKGKDAEVGRQLTGGDGRALLRYTPRMDGHFAIRVVFPGSTRATRAEAFGLLASWERRRPILFVDVASLLPARPPSTPLLPGLELPSTGGRLTEPVAEAAVQLERLTRFYLYVVYVLRGPGVALDEFRTWLKQHEFPPGLTRIVAPGKDALASLLDAFAEQGFKNIKGGVGRSREFADLFASRRKAAVILSESGELDGYPRKTKWSKDWLDVRKHLQG